MASPQARLVKLLVRATLKHEPHSERKLVRRLRMVMNAPMLPKKIPAGIRIRKSILGGVKGQWIETGNPTITVLYLHGGAFIGGRVETYYSFCSKLAQHLNARIFLPTYRLAPEHRFPAAVEDVINVYRQLCSERKCNEHLIVAGDSAGGNLALVALMAARDANLHRAICGIIISPSVDMNGTLRSLKANSDTDCMLNAKMIEMAISVYLQGADPRDPRASPGLDDFRDLPPLIVTVSEEECLRDDAYVVSTKVKAAGGQVQLLSRPDLPHVWPVFYDFLPEARQDMKKICSFITQALAQNETDMP